jgi:hypothetical protein
MILLILARVGWLRRERPLFVRKCWAATIEAIDTAQSSRPSPLIGKSIDSNPFVLEFILSWRVLASKTASLATATRLSNASEA